MKYLKIYESFRYEKGISFNEYVNTHHFSNDMMISPGLQDLGLTDLKGIEKFTDLKECWCQRNKLTSLEGIENCETLRLLQISENRLQNLKGIEKLSNLKYLNVSFNLLKNLDEIKNLNIKTIYFYNNPWEFPLENKLIWLWYTNEAETPYSEENKKHFRTYECQKKFIEKYPERVKELEQFGIHEKIKEEFADIIEGNEFGFFNLR